MKVCVVGAGSIGGLVGVKLALAGNDVTLIVRGAALAAVRSRGMTLIDEHGASHIARVEATDRIADAGAQDLVILAVKAHQVQDVVRELPWLYADHTAVLTAQNGLPWWYFFKYRGPHAGYRIQTVDPGGIIAEHLPIDRVIGAVVHPAAEIVEPGVIRHIEGLRLPVGEIDGQQTERITKVSELLRSAGFKSPVLSDIRSEIWTKLWGNLSFNPISALTHATLDEICRFAATRSLAAAMMTEAQAIAEALGVRFKVSLDKRIAGAEAVGAHKTSMLQDLEAGRPLELAALVESVAELGRLTGTPSPHIDAVVACTSLLDRTVRAANGRCVVLTRA